MLGQIGGCKRLVAEDERVGFIGDGAERNEPVIVVNSACSAVVTPGCRVVPGSEIGSTPGTCAQKIAKLVNASGKGVPVVEELPHGDLWNHSGPQ